MTMGLAIKGFRQYLFFPVFMLGIAAHVDSHAAEKNEPYRIGIHIWKSGKIYDEALQGIRDGLKLEDFDYKEILLHADKDKQKAVENFKKLDGMGLDVIFSLSSAGTKIAKELNLKTPIISTVVNHPVSLGMDLVEGDTASKITGTSYYIDAGLQLDFYKSLFKKIKAVGMILDRNNPAGYLAEEPLMEKACKKAGIKFHSIAVNDETELAKATNDLLEKKVSLIIIPTNKLIYENLDRILKITHHRRMPVVSMSKQGVENGALAGLFADTYKLGRYTTKMVTDIVVNKKDAMDLPFAFIDDPDIAINISEADKLGYEFPPQVLGAAAIILH